MMFSWIKNNFPDHQGSLVVLLLACVLFYACEKNSASVGDLPGDQTLEAYVDAQPQQLTLNLIACAAGGQQGYFDDAVYPISIFFYPPPGAREFRYFETETIAVNPDDWSAYQKTALDIDPIFGGYLQRFLRAPVAQDIWCRVTFLKGDSLHVSNAIRIKFANKPTEFAPQLLTVDYSDSLQPLFSWQPGRIDEDAIYFQVVADAQQQLLSGTYTYQRQFRFYDLDNVVLNIRDVTPAPVLIAGENYSFSLMGVSLDNWVNLLIHHEFVAR